MRTPKPWADRSVQGNPRAQSIAIPNTGHSVIGSDLSGCASSLAKRFLLFGTTDGRCRKTARPLSIAPLPARSLRSVKQRRGSCRGLRGSRCLIERKRLTAGYLALRDTFDQILIGNTTYGVGLIDGSWEFDLDFEDESDSLVIPLSLRINGISSVPGVSVSGSLAMDNLPQVSGVLTINGRRVQVSGRVDYYADRDRLTLSTRSRGKSARIQVTARRGAANTAGAPTQRRLGLRQTFALASGQRR